MVEKFVGTFLRAFLVMLVIVLPSLLLPHSNRDATEIMALIALSAGALVVFEYASAYPGLIEFRDAPPFNRIRFASLFVTVLVLSLLMRGTQAPGLATGLVTSVGVLVGGAIDFAYSPVRLVILMLPADTGPVYVDLVRAAAGLAYLVSLLTLAVFIIVLRFKVWPSRTAFNVWVNLPTFDPTAGGDVVARLERDARFNIALGFLLPFVAPAAIKASESVFGAMALDNPQTLIWMVSAWSFMPASLFMRGIAMGRIARMIESKRRGAAGASEGFVPA